MARQNSNTSKKKLGAPFIHPKDLAGVTFGKLTAIRIVGKTSENRDIWLCRCCCGTSVERPRNSLLHQKFIHSCGCAHSGRKRFFKHGLSGTPEHRVWSSMIQRCGDLNCNAYPRYGGRGIKVCERWLDFANFYADIGPRPSSLHTIERIDNNKGYEPDNCCWATKAEQNQNTRNNVNITYNGQTKCLAEWGRIIGVSVGTVHARLKRGWSPERAVSTPRVNADEACSRGRRARYNGERFDG